MRKLVRDSQNVVKEIILVKGSIPEGYTEVPSEEVEAEELVLARKNKMSLIRSQRDQLLLENDKQWLIASKTGQSVTQIEADAQILRDLPESAQTAVDALTTVEEIKAYDPFEE